MYDKVKLWAMRTRETPDVSRFLDKAKDQIDYETGEVCTFGSLEGLKVSIYTGGISVIGSLPKFLYQNNVYPLDRHGTAQAVEKLSDSLHLPIADAKVTGLEFGRAFVMKHSVENYLSKLGDMPKLLRYHLTWVHFTTSPEAGSSPKYLLSMTRKPMQRLKVWFCPLVLIMSIC